MEFEQIFVWKESWLAPVLAIGGVTVAFIAYYFLMISPKMERIVRGSRDLDEGQVRWITFQRVWGGFVLGATALLLPAIGLGEWPGKFGMSFYLTGEMALVVLGAGILIIGINALRAGKPANLLQYPQIRIPVWTYGTLATSSMGWIVYLFGYELMFRGFLLFGCIEALGIWPAIAINTAIYSFAHFFKGIGETVGAIPFGVLMCVLTLYHGNFLPAFIIHIFLALSNQTVAMLAHPDIKFGRR